MLRQLAGAIDIGGTHIRVSLISPEGVGLVIETMPTLTGEGSAAVCVEMMYEKLIQQCAQMSVSLSDLAGIGIVCAGPIDSERGIILNPYTLPGWENYHIVERLHELSGLPAKLEHDVNGALLGEVFLNQWSGKRVLMVNFGTGIGVAVFDKDHTFRAGAKYHPEMGHVVVDSLSRESCYCRHNGCFESVWSGTALAKLARRMNCDSFEVLFDRWRADDSFGAEMSRLQRLFCVGIWNLMVVFKPDILVLGGGLMQRYFPFCAKLIGKDLEGLADFVECFEILPAKDNGISAVVGASRLIFDNL